MSLAALLLLLLAGCATVPMGPAPVASLAPSSGPEHPVVHTVRSLVGSPYRLGGDSPAEGFDCSGLTHYVYLRIGVRLPRTAREQYRHLSPVRSRRALPGDLVFFRIPEKRSIHVGIYVGDDLFIHAPSPGKRVRYASLSNPYWHGSYLGAGRASAKLPLQRG